MPIPSLVLRTEKGFALEWSELDDNFREISQSYAILTGSNYYSGSNNYTGNVTVINRSLTTGFGHTLNDNSRRSFIAGGYNTASLPSAVTRVTHIEGMYNSAFGELSHHSGMYNYSTATGDSAHIEGYGNTASALYLHIEGLYNSSSVNEENSFIAGQYNVPQNDKSTFVIGGGTNSSNRKNILVANTASVKVSASAYCIAGIPPGSFNNSLAISASNLFITASVTSYDIDAIVAGANTQVQFIKNTELFASPRFTFFTGSTPNNVLTVSGSLSQGLYPPSISGSSLRAGGLNTIASGSGQTVVGRYNVKTGDYQPFIVGIGNGNNNRINGFSVTKSGSLVLKVFDWIIPQAGGNVRTSFRAAYGDGVPGELVIGRAYVGTTGAQYGIYLFVWNPHLFNNIPRWQYYEFEPF